MTISKILRLSCFLFATHLAVTPIALGSDSNTTDEGAWLKSTIEAWAEEDKEFKNSPTSPLAGTQRFTIEDTSTAYFTATDAELAWTAEPADQAVFSLTLSDGQWRWSGRDNQVALTRRDEIMSSGTLLAGGDRLKAGRLTVEFYPSAEKITVLVFDPTTERLKTFKTLDRFEPDSRFVAKARIEKFDNPEQLELITARQEYKKQYRYARLHFEIEDTSLGLTAYKHALEGGGSNILFIPFTDKTTGKYTYGGGRYMIVEEPAEGDEVLIDFNLVINPLCSYAAIYNCIVPTRENKLPIAITAGVKKYH